MKEYYVSIAVILIIILAFIFSKLYTSSQKNRLRKLVAWCVLENSNEFRNGFSLLTCINNTHHDLKLSDSYAIKTNADIAMANQIINEFQKDLSQKYYSERLSPIKSIRKIPEIDYFMYKLCDFLDNHQCDSTFLGYEMHKKIINHKIYGSYGGTLYDAKYELSDFALVYHKIYYVAYCACKSSKVFNSKGDNFIYDQKIKKIIDSRQISISAF